MTGDLFSFIGAVLSAFLTSLILEPLQSEQICALRTGVLDILTRVLDIRTRVLDIRAKVFDILMRIPGKITRVPDILTRVPDILTRVLDTLTRVLDIRTRVLDILTRVLGIQSELIFRRTPTFEILEATHGLGRKLPALEPPRAAPTPSFRASIWRHQTLVTQTNSHRRRCPSTSPSTLLPPPPPLP